MAKADKIDKRIKTLIKMHANPRYQVLADHKIRELIDEYGEDAMRVRMHRILKKMRFNREIR